MERASRSLAQMDYLACEALCLEALAAARQRGDWTYYARVLLPLQEARRQRRMIACDAGVFMDQSDPEAGIVVVTPPRTRDDAAKIEQTAKTERRFVEVLYVARCGDATWTVASHRGARVSVDRPAPHGRPDVGWCLAASEALGDAALALVDEPPGAAGRIAALETMLAAVADHEILHQRLGDAARAMK